MRDTRLLATALGLGTGHWALRLGPDGSFKLEHGQGVVMAECRPRIEMDGDSYLPLERHSCEEPGGGAPGFSFLFPRGIRLRMTFEEDRHGWLGIGARVLHEGENPVSLGRLTPLHTTALHSVDAMPLCYRHGRDLIDLCTLDESPASESHGCIGFTGRSGDAALVLGFEDLGQAFCTFDAQMEQNAPVRLGAHCLCEGVSVAPGEQIGLPRLLVAAGPSLTPLLREYAERVGRSMGARRARSPETGLLAATGWCSWYHYYGTENEADIAENTIALEASPLGRHIRVIQIDDGWNLTEAGGVRRWGDWWPGAKFPQGMAAAAERIRAAGFVPGLWVAPFSVAPDSRLRQDHPEWLVRDGEGAPALYWGVHALDVTHPEALDFVRETFVRVFDEWGFGYVKIDFLAHAVQPGHRHNPSLTTAQAFRNGLATIRDVAGDRFVLGCGSPLGPAVGLVDGMRIGHDVSSVWDVPRDGDVGALALCNIRSAAIQTVRRQWMHDAWWQNDPDCLVVRDQGTEPERALFGTDDGTGRGRRVRHGLTDEEAAFWVRLVWITGGMLIVSERIGELSAVRWQLLCQAFPPNPTPGHLVDWYHEPDTAVFLSEGPPPVVGVFNWSDRAVRIRVPARKLGLEGPWSFSERDTGETFRGSSAAVAFPVLPPHAGRLWIPSPEPGRVGRR